MLIDKLKDKLKQLDMFKSKAGFKISRKVKRSKHGERTYEPSLGSIYGGLLTMMLWFIMGVLIEHGIRRMFSGAGDNTQSKVLTNRFLPGED